MSEVASSKAGFVFVSIVLSKHAEREFVLGYCGNNPGSSEEDAQRVLQSYRKSDGTFRLDFLTDKFIVGRKKSKECVPGGLSSPATTVVTIK